MSRDPKREVEFQTRVLDAIKLLLEIKQIADSPALGTLREMASDIEMEFAEDEAVAARFRNLDMPATGPFAELRGVNQRTLGRILRAATEPAEVVDRA